MFVLDTDHITLLEHGRSREAERLLARLAEVAETDVATTIISFEEQTRGWLSYLARSRSLTQQVEAYVRLRRMLDNYCLIPLLDFDEASAAKYQRLTRARLRVGSMDLKIAAITLAHQGTLITRNRADFAKVPGLKIDDWTVE